MATRSKDSSLAADHQRDLYSWLMEQARLVRDGRWQAIEQDNLAKEIERLAEQQFDQLENAIHGLLTHLLKWDHPAIRRSRGRVQSVQSQRQAVADVLARNPGLGPVLIEGHTDNVGARSLNLSLSDRRAKAVLEYLVGKGIDRKRLRSQGFGFDRPIASNKTPLGRAKNRRVEFRLVKSEVETPPREVPGPTVPGPTAPGPTAPGPTLGPTPPGPAGAPAPTPKK